MNYLDIVATEIQRQAGDLGESLGLYRIYAALALAKGDAVTDADVHHAWAAWRAGDDPLPQHRHLIPFEQLAPDVQAQDAPYTEAIRRAVRMRTALDSSPPKE